MKIFKNIKKYLISNIQYSISLFFILYSLFFFVVPVQAGACLDILGICVGTDEKTCNATWFPNVECSQPDDSTLSPEEDTLKSGVSKKINQQMDKAGTLSGLGARDPRETAARAINISLGILGMLFVCYTIYAGFLYMTAGGEEEKVEESKKHLRNAVIGLVIILAALSVSLLVTTYLIRATAEQYYQLPPIYSQ